MFSFFFIFFFVFCLFFFAGGAVVKENIKVRKFNHRLFYKNKLEHLTKLITEPHLV